MSSFPLHPCGEVIIELSFSVWPPFPGAGQGYWSLLDQNDGELFVSRQLKQDTAQFELTEGLDLKEPKPVVKKDLKKKPASKTTSVGGDNQKKSDNKKGGRRQF